MTQRRRVGVFASLSLVTQLLAMVAGIIVVRGLDKPDYALYAIAFAAISGANAIVSAGISSTLLARGGRSLRDGGTVARAAKAAHWVRRRSLLLASVPTVALVSAMFIANGADPFSTIVAGIATLVAIWSALSADLSRIVLQLHNRLAAIQWIMVTSATLRVVMFAALLLVPERTSSEYVITFAAVGVVDAFMLHKASRQFKKSPEKADPAEKHEFIVSFRRSIIAVSLLAIGDQVVNVLLTLAGNTDGIAEVTALSRFSIAFVALNTTIFNIAAPALARLPNSRGEIRQGTLRMISVYGGFSLAYVTLGTICAPLLLWLLGPGYEDLTTELTIVLAGSAIANFAMGGIGAVNHARGWLRWSWTYALFYALWIGGNYLFNDLSTSVGAAILRASLAVAMLAPQVVRYVAGYRSIPRNTD